MRFTRLLLFVVYVMQCTVFPTHLRMAQAHNMPSTATYSNDTLFKRYLIQTVLYSNGDGSPVP